jgi:hypothetical protein
MLVSYGQVIQLLESIAIATPDSLDCDGCFELIAEFAEAVQRGDPLSDSLKLVQNHVQQCACCAYEYEALLEAILAAGEP